MKRLTTILMLVAAVAMGFSALAQQPKKSYRVYGVGFYNLENLFDTIPNNPLGRDEEYTPNGKNQWNGEKYRNKIKNMARAIAAMTTKTTPNGPAILGVSEIENRSVLEDLVRDPQIARWNLQIVHHDSPDRRGVDVGMLYNPRYFTVENVTNHTLIIPRNPNLRTRDQMVVVGRLHGEKKAGGDLIAVIVNHWPSRLGGEEQSSYLREAAAALSKHIADSLWKVHPEIGVVVMGDLNDDPTNNSVKKVLGAKKKAEQTKAHDFYNPFEKILVDDGIGTLAYKGSWNLFDQIILSGNILSGEKSNGLEFVRAIVNNFDFLTTKEGTRDGYPHRTFSGGVYLNGYSDHYPTMVLFKQEAK